ncbi:MAG: RICIN domain-containing protein [Prevotella sp.]|nr:RICIN domain-containing protein [Prevotella sp.]
MKLKTFTIVFLFTATTAVAQDNRSSSSQYLSTIANSDVVVPFRIGDEGVKLPIRWGMDVAWNNSQNMRKGINHIGKENLSLVRGSFRTDAPLAGDTALTSSQIRALRNRMQTINIMSDTCDIILNSDQEAGVDEWYGTSGNANVDHWVAMISANIEYIKKNYPKHRVLGISPFNEPDFTDWKQGSKTNQKEIARQLKEKYPDLIITAGNTLNCDRALEWYNACRPYVDWGNTHQLAGSFDNYASFFTKVRNDGNYGYADELHNVGEAMVGVEYGMQAGVWWGFDSRARGEFCRISNTGSRIGYGENRSKWTSASVYRDDETQAVKAFVGSSERQANTSTFSFVSSDREVYFDGHGPQRAFVMEIPGGTGYQNGQTNAERVIDITYGADVPPSAITPGTYKIMNAATCGVVAVNGTADGNPNISQMKWTGAKTQQWNIDLVDPRIGGDYSFYKITNVSNSKYMNVLNNGTSTANIISYDAKCASNEQWYLEYAGDGCYFIRNRESGLFMELTEKSTASGINIRQNKKATDEAKLRLQMWRILPTDADCETNAPAQPQGLTAEARRASVSLSWTANTEEDLAGYMVLRAEQGTGKWNTIARKVTATDYVDNTCRQGVAYDYCIKAIDKSENQSEVSAAVSAQPTAAKGVIAQWQFEDALTDATDNYFDVVHSTTPLYIDNCASGQKALNMDGTVDYLLLPYEIADMDEMSISLWAYWTNPSSSNARLFDFGNGTTQYMYLTPTNGKGMCFGIKNGDTEQQLANSRRLTARAWKHVVVTIKEDYVAIYVDGEQVASTSDISIKPSDLRTSINYLGRGQSASVPKYRGYLDDVRIYNYALSPDEVLAVMEDATNGIDLIDDGDQSRKVDAVYDLQGRRLPGGSMRGIQIRQHADGSAEKVIVK